MSLPDGAEYWNDVKSSGIYLGKTFYCLPKADCGYRTHHVASFLKEVNCKGCLKLIEEGYVEKELDGKTDYRSKGQKKRDRKHDLHQEKLKKWGNCDSCGKQRVERLNTKTEQLFYGCSGYPKCKKTSPVINKQRN